MGGLLEGVPLDLLLSPWGLGLLGLIVGSFLNVVVHRLPLMLQRQWWGDVAAQLSDTDSYKQVFGQAAPNGLVLAAGSLEKTLADAPPLGIARPASRCPSCGHQIRFYENIPLVSWLLLRGKCSACKAPIGLRYPLVELATAALFALVAWRFGAQPGTLLWCGAVAVLLALALIDWDTTVLPDALTLPLLWAGLALAALGWLPGLTLMQSFTGAVVGYLALWSVYWLFKLTTGKEGMGYGDFKLLAAIGAWLGWVALPLVILLSSMVGAVLGLAMIAAGRHGRDKPMPFGPYLAAAGAIALFWGPEITRRWLPAFP